MRRNAVINQRRIAVINQKGGVGKTTTTANLGAALARAGAKVLLIDLDPQSHLSLYFGVELSADQPSIYDVLTSGLRVDEAMIKVSDHLSLLPADIDLAGAEVELVSVTGREVLLREALEPVSDQFEFMLIDCPPALGVLTVNALCAMNEVLIPLQAHFLALQGLGRLLQQTVTLVRQRINPNLTVAGIALCMHDSTTRLASEVVEDLTGFLENARGTNVAWAGARVYKTFIRRNIKLAESASFGQSVFDYAPRSNGAIDYERLAIEIFGEPARRAVERERTKKVNASDSADRVVASSKDQKKVIESADSEPSTVDPEVSPPVTAKTTHTPTGGTPPDPYRHIRITAGAQASQPDKLSSVS